MEVQVGELINKAKVNRCGDGDYPVLSMTMHDGLMFQNDRFKKQIASVDQSNYQVVKRHQLVESFPIDEGVLAVQELTEEGIVSPAYKIWDVNMDRVIPVYLELALRAPRSIEYYKSKLRGTTARRRSITDAEFCAMQINLPDLKEQERIIELISRARAISAKRQQELDTLDNLIKARFVELFGSISNNKFGYEVMTLQDVCEPIKDGTHQTPTYTEDTINGYKFLSSKDVTSGKVDWNHLKYIPEELHNELYKRISPSKGDILLAKNGTTGVAAIVDRDEVFDIYVSLALLRPLGMVTSEYLCAAVNSIETKHQFDSSLKGIGVPNLHLGEIKKTKIVVPPIEAQEKFADFVKQVDKSKVV